MTLDDFCAALGISLDTQPVRHEPLAYKGRIKLSAQIEKGRSVSQPDQGDAFRLFAPSGLKASLKAKRQDIAQSPIKALDAIAPGFANHPRPKASAAVSSPVLAYQKKSEKVVDRIETSTCTSCNGGGKKTAVRSEPTYTPCGACGGRGGSMVTEYISKPGTTADGMAHSSYRACAYCGGAGKSRGLDKTITETLTCSTCKGSGQIEKKIYKTQTYFETHHVVTRAEMQGRETLPKIVKTLRKISGGAIYGSDAIWADAGDAEVSLAEKPKRIDIDATLSLPLQSRHAVGPNGAPIGTLYCAPAAQGASQPVALTAFLDGPLSAKLGAYAAVTHDQVDGLTQTDPLFGYLYLSDPKADLSGDVARLGWAITPKALQKAIKSVQKSRKRGMGLLQRLRS